MCGRKRPHPKLTYHGRAFLEELRENTKNFSQNNQCFPPPPRFEPGTSEYKCEALPLNQLARCRRKVNSYLYVQKLLVYELSLYL
jgi:hypothetical protein